MRAIAVALLLLTGAGLGDAQTMSQPRDDCALLLNAVLPFAERMLKEHGEFFPFGGALRPNGEIVSVAATDGRDQPASADVIRQLRAAFVTGARSNEYKATALAYDVRIVLPGSGDKSDAIAVALDHRDNYSVVVMVPYKIAAGAVSLAQPISQKGESAIFGKH